MKTLDGALEWIRKYEPQLGESLDGRLDQVEDFLKVSDFSYGCKQCFNGADRWSLVGEAGAFLDPFYSPGSDFIAISNTLSTDLITRFLDGEDVVDRAAAFDDLYLNTYRVNLTQYEGQYEFWHNAMVMTVKICANNILYWGTECLLFFHDKYTTWSSWRRCGRTWSASGRSPAGSRRCTASGMRSRTGSGGGRSCRRRRSPGCSSATSTWPAGSTMTACGSAWPRPLT